MKRSCRSPLLSATFAASACLLFAFVLSVPADSGPRAGSGDGRVRGNFSLDLDVEVSLGGFKQKMKSSLTAGFRKSVKPLGRVASGGKRFALRYESAYEQLEFNKIVKRKNKSFTGRKITLLELKDGSLELETPWGNSREERFVHRMASGLWRVNRVLRALPLRRLRPGRDLTSRFGRMPWLDFKYKMKRFRHRVVFRKRETRNGRRVAVFATRLFGKDEVKRGLSMEVDARGELVADLKTKRILSYRLRGPAVSRWKRKNVMTYTGRGVITYDIIANY